MKNKMFDVRKGSLLERAIQSTGSSKSTISIPDDEIELALAWLGGFVNGRQVAAAVGTKTVVNWVMPRIRLAYTRGILLNRGLTAA